MKALFFIAFAAYAVSVILEFSGTAFRKKGLLRAAGIAFLAAFALHSVCCRTSLNLPTASPGAWRSLRLPSVPG